MTPTATTTAEAPTAAASPDASATAAPAALRLLYREFGSTADTIWEADAAEPGQRRRLASISHAPDWGTYLSLSPDQRSIAYTVLPEGAQDAASEAEVWVLGLADLQSTRVADAADLRAPPAWSPDGKSLYVRRNTADSIRVIELDLGGGEKTLVEKPRQEIADLSAVGFTADGASLYYVESGGPAGTNLGIVNISTGERETIMRLSDQLAREFALSPDGKRLAFFDPFRLRSYVADIETRTVIDLPAGPQGAVYLHPIWQPGGEVVTVGQPPSNGQPGAASNIALAGGSDLLAAPETGFDIPLMWAPGSLYLVVRWFRGDSLTSPGPASLLVISQDGARTDVAQGTDVEPIGWTGA
ncbi:MAG TPA: hypothetical protein VFT91_04685 [Dehalococcoidia bacterium]|nr:hypothetical protein [Dehalococcoidia bacterium]